MMTDETLAWEHDQMRLETQLDCLADERRYAPGLVELPVVSPKYRALIDNIHARHCLPVSAVLPD